LQAQNSLRVTRLPLDKTDISVKVHIIFSKAWHILAVQVYLCSSRRGIGKVEVQLHREQAWIFAVSGAKYYVGPGRKNNHKEDKGKNLKFIYII